MKGTIDRLRPDGDPYIDERLWRWSVTTMFIASSLIGLGGVATALGAPGLGGALLLAGLLHFVLLPEDGPIRVGDDDG
jgi:hypothetical protein